MKNTVYDRLQKYRVISSENECYGWTGAKDKLGFARMFYKNRSVGAHRVTWIDEFGEIPKNSYINHSCKNKECTNPRHLFLSLEHPSRFDPEKQRTNRIGRIRLSIDIPKKIHHELKMIASGHNQTMTKYLVRRFIEIIKYEKSLAG